VVRKRPGRSDISRGEIETATQHLYGYLSIHAVAKRRPRAFAALNEHPLFWNTVAGALQTSALVALGRIFDQNSAHNIDALIRLATKNRVLFSTAALAKRKNQSGGDPPPWATSSLQELTCRLLPIFGDSGQ